MTCCCNCKPTGCQVEVPATGTGSGDSTVVPTPASTIASETPAEEQPAKGESTDKNAEESSDTSKDEDEDEEPKRTPVPMKPTLINLITKYDMSAGDFVTKPATSSSLSQADDQWEEYAITLTSAFDNEGNFSRKILEIKAPVLKELCVKIIGDKYPGQSFKTEKVCISCPPKPLFFYREEFEKVRGLWKERLAVLRKEDKERKIKEKEEEERKEREKAEKGETETPAAEQVEENKEEEKPTEKEDKKEEDEEDLGEDDDTPLDIDDKKTTALLPSKSYLEKTLPELTEDLKYINLFMRVLKSELREQITTYNSLVPQGLINYDMLWTIFPPHVKFLTHNHNHQQQLFQLHKGVEITNGCNPRFHLDCFGVDHDGFTFGYAASAAGVPPFEGEIPISSLPAVPLEYLPDAEKVVRELIVRGRKSEKLQCSGSSFMVYKGRALGPVVDQRRTYYSINGRVMVDPSSFARVNPERAVTVNSLQARNPYASDEDNYWWSRSHDAYESGHNGVTIDLGINNAKHNITEKTTDRGGKFYIPLTDEQAAMVHPFARGYALAEKKWGEFAVVDLTEVQWARDAFDKLVLPEEQKELILSLVEAAPTDNLTTSASITSAPSSSGKYRFDDFIPSKGLGLVAVLHGPPGVGKTLTAESVAEYTQRPLISVTSGELGTKPSSLESTLEQVLELAGTWNAILLIDEADIFLEARSSSTSSSSITRNALVSIFLRLLEYFRGVMFLTTNRVETFDPAFKSRIHLAMKYKELSEDARVEVWKNFIQKLPEGIREGELLDGDYPGVLRLARRWAGINGREIKNAVKTGLRIVQRRGGKLSTEVLEGVLTVGGEFDAQMRVTGK